MSVPSILDLDLAGFESGDPARRRAVIDGVARSLGTAFVVVRSPFEDAFLDEVYGLLATFFDLPQEVKDKYIVEGGKGQTGYTPASISEVAVGSDRPDAKQMVNWGVELPLGHPLRDRFPHRYIERCLPEDDVPGITTALDRFHTEMAELQRRLLRVIAVVMGCHENFFEGMITEGPHLARAIHYPPASAVPPGTPGAAAHEDINLTTVVPRATRAGFQLFIEDEDAAKEEEEKGTWHDVMAPDGFSLCNTGDMMRRLSNNRFGRGRHRVNLGDDERISVVQFCHPTPWTILGPVPSCCGPDNPQRYSPIAAGDWLDMRLHELGLYGM